MLVADLASSLLIRVRRTYQTRRHRPRKVINITNPVKLQICQRNRRCHSALAQARRGRGGPTPPFRESSTKRDHSSRCGIGSALSVLQWHRCDRRHQRWVSRLHRAGIRSGVDSKLEARWGTQEGRKVKLNHPATRRGRERFEWGTSERPAESFRRRVADDAGRDFFVPGWFTPRGFQGEWGIEILQNEPIFRAN